MSKTTEAGRRCLRRRLRRRSTRSSRAREPGDRCKPHDSGARGDGERTGRRPGSLVPRLSLERDRVAVVHANRARVLAHGAWRDGRAKGGQLLRVGRVSAGAAAHAAVGVVPGRDERQDARALHTAASRNAALGPGRRDDLRGGAAGRGGRADGGGTGDGHGDVICSAAQPSAAHFGTKRGDL